MRLTLVLIAGISILSAQTKPRARSSGCPSKARPVRSMPSPMSPASRSATRTLIAGDSGAHRRHRRLAARQAVVRPRLRRLLLAERQRRYDRHHWLEESGFLDGPVLITNTHSVGVVRDAYLGWLVKNNRQPGTNTFAAASTPIRSWPKPRMAS